MKRFLAEVQTRDPLLSRVGWIHVGLAMAMLAGLALDPRLVLGINPWWKPLKFAVSITVYVWTVAWLLGDVQAAAPRAARWISRGVALSMLVEITCIAGQSLRGVASHFNHDTSLDEAVFNVMGSMIALNTCLTVWLLALYFRVETGLSRPQLWGARLGLLFFIGGSAVGGLMIGHGSHTVGAADGGPGLPLVNWSTRAGDIRAAHAVGLHALQVLILVGWAASRARALRPPRQTAVVFAAAAVYLLVAAAILAQALAGRPLLPV